MSQIYELFSHGALSVVWLIVSVVSGIVAILFREQIAFRIVDAYYVFPWVGKIERMAKNPTQSPRPGWTTQERALCAFYARSHIISETDFKDTLEYLRLSGDIGREPQPAWAWLFISLLVLAEGYGFSYLLGTWVTREGDANLYRVLAAFIAFVICGLMLYITHNAGRELHRTGLLRSCRAKFRANERTGIDAKDGKNKSFFTEPMSIGDVSDNTFPLNVRCANRVADHSTDEGGRVWISTSILAMIFIAVLSFWMRHENLNRELISNNVVQSATAGNPFAIAADKTPRVSDAAKSESIADEKSEGGAAFLLLSGIFILTQVVSIGLGFKYGFAGKQGKLAYQNTHGFVTYSSYYNSPVFRLAQARLQMLQHLMDISAFDRQGGIKTFADYCREEADHESHALVATESTKPLTAEQHANAVTQIESREGKLKYLNGLVGENMRESVKVFLANKKAASLYEKEEAEFGGVI